jgi:hypothetical protein
MTVYDALAPLKATPVAPVKFEPWISTDVPGGPLTGAKFVIFGAVANAGAAPNAKPTTTVQNSATVALRKRTALLRLPKVLPPSCRPIETA